MAFTFGPQVGQGIEQSFFEFQELASRQAQFEQFQLQQAGFTEQERQVSVEEGLRQADPVLRATHERTTEGLQKVMDALGQFGITKEQALQAAPGEDFGFSTGDPNFVPLWIKQVKDFTKELGQIETKITTVREFAKSPELLEQEAIQRESLARQRELTQSILERQIAAQRGETELSPAREQQRQEEFETFKEAQARAGRIILGETPEEAVAKGTAAEQSLRRFQNQLEASRLAEREAVIGQAGQAFGAAQLAGGLAPGFFQPATLPTQPSLLGLQSLQTALQPFQFQQQMALQAAMLEEQKAASGRSARSGLLGAGIGAGGAIVGGALGGPLGAALLGSFGSATTGTPG
jgi:hypothetical protein